MTFSLYWILSIFGLSYHSLPRILFEQENYNLWRGEIFNSVCAIMQTNACHNNKWLIYWIDRIYWLLYLVGEIVVILILILYSR